MRAGSKLVHHEGAVCKHKELHGDQSDHPELFRNRGSNLPSPQGDPLIQCGGSDSDIENAVAVDIFLNGKAAWVTVRRTRADHRGLRNKRDPPFQNSPEIAVLRGKLHPGGIRVISRRESDLPLAIVAQGGGFENRGRAERGKTLRQFAG